MPTPQEVQRHAVQHSVASANDFTWGLWLLSTFDGQERIAELAGVRVTNVVRGKHVKSWAMYERLRVPVEFCPTHYAGMTPLNIFGRPL